MARDSSAFISTIWLCISTFLLLPSDIYCGDPTRCGEVILLDADQPTAEVTSTDHYFLREEADDNGATAECLWYFRSPPGTTIRLDIVASQTSNSPVIIHDGLGVETNDDDNGIQLGGSHESSFISSGRVITCKLPTHSTDVNQEEYSITLQATLQGEMSINAANPGQCGGTIYLNQNSPTSNFKVTNTYSSGGAAYCNWYINSPPDTKIVIEFFDWQELDHYDYLYIYDSRGRQVYRLRGDSESTPYPVMSDSSARLHFDAYYSVSNTNFAVKVSYTDELKHNSEGVLRSSGGEIELNENTTSLTIQSTNHTSYVRYMNGYWYVTGPVGRRLKIQFHQLNAGDFTVYDSSSTSRPISRLSVPTAMPKDGIFSQNSATLSLFLNSGNYEGVGVLFTISIADEYPAVGPDTCGGTIALDIYQEHFVFSSPYYYNQQPPSGQTDCWWYVTSPTGKQVQLDWLDIDTTNEYVNVYDYPSSTSYQVSRFQGNVDVDLSPFVSTRGGITIMLDDASSGSNGRGFLANVSLSDTTTVVGPRSCGGTVMLSNSMPNFTLNSPYYYQPSSAAYVDCYWHVHGYSGQEVQLTWLDINTPSYYIYLNDYLYYSSYPVAYIRGDIDVDISPVVSTRGGWTVRHYDYYSGNNGRGFLADFRLRDTPYYSSPASCGGTIPLSQASPNATISSPYYYQLSVASVNMDCYWYITCPSGKQVQLTVRDLETYSERVYINDHPTSTSSSYRVSYLYGRLESPATILSSRGGVLLHYDDYSSGNSGPGVLFEARIIDSKPAYQPGFCGGTVALTDTSPDFTFTTPLYNDPSTSNVDMDCWMYITCPSGKQVQLTIRDFDTRSEYIWVYDHTSSTSSSYRMSQLSGRLDSQAVMISSRGGLTIYYYDSSTSYNGPGAFFEARVIDTIPSNITGFCGGVIPLSTSTPRVTTTTPLFYEPSTSDVLIDCWWYVRSTSGKQVEMSVHDFQTENEYVYVYDHPSSSSYQVSRLRGHVSDSTVVSTRGGFSVVFDDTSTSENGRGFSMDAALTDALSWDEGGIDSCGQTIYLDSSSPSIVFSTPTYPTEVLNDAYVCFWYLTCPYGYRISLSFDDFDTFSSSYFRVYDSSSTSSTYQLAEISSDSMPGTAAIQSSSNALTVYYYDNDWSDVTNQRGVLVTASIVPTGEPVWEQAAVPMSSCGSSITLTSQYNHIELTTPDYPSVSGDYYQCTWFVECPSQARVQINFNDFWLDSYGYLRVHDGPTTSYSTLLHATGSSLPNSVVSNSHTMTAYYYNNRGTSGKGASFVMSCVFEANVVCDSTSMTVFLDRGFLLNGTDANDVHLVNEDCVGIDHDSTQIVLYTRYDMCSTTIEETESSIIYSNMVTYYTHRPIAGTEITREDILQMPVQCELDRHRLLGDSFIPKTGLIRFNETGYGEFSLQMDRYTDGAFDKIVHGDEGVVTLGEHLYFAVNLTSVTGLTVFIENCWATPSEHPNGAKNYNFLSNGCSEDPTMHMIYSSDPSFSQFVIDAFTFIDENPQVFIHCEVLVCNHDDPSSRCAKGCQTRLRRESRHTRGTSSTPHLISNGPLSTFQTMRIAETHNTDGSPAGLESGILVGALAGITCLLVAAVAIILYMMPSRRMSQHGYQRVNINEDDQ